MLVDFCDVVQARSGNLNHMPGTLHKGFRKWVQGQIINLTGLRFRENDKINYNQFGRKLHTNLSNVKFIICPWSQLRKPLCNVPGMSFELPNAGFPDGASNLIVPGYSGTRFALLPSGPSRKQGSTVHLLHGNRRRDPS